MDLRPSSLAPILRRLRHVVAPLLAVLVALFVALAPVGAAPGPSAARSATPSFTITGAVMPIADPAVYRTSGAIFFESAHVPLRLQSATYYIVVGRLTQGHFEYPYQLTAARGSAVGAIELGANFTTHTQLIAVGVPTSASLAMVMGLAPAGGQSATSTVAGGSHTAAPSPLTASTSGYYRTVWHDPVGIEVNEVKDSISFTYDGIYVDSFGGSDYRWWLSNDGWYEASHSIGSYYNSNHTKATVWTYDHFANGIFCLFQTTHVYYSDNNVYGFGSGAVGGGVNTWASGGCSGLLSYYTVVGGGR